jgi:hypothetical protein
MLRDAWESAMTRKPQTFNNWLGFEQGLWQHHTRCVAGVPKKKVLKQAEWQLCGLSCR